MTSPPEEGQHRSPNPGASSSAFMADPGVLESQGREEKQEMRSEGTLSPPLRTGTGKPLPITVTPPPTATCRCRRDLSPPTHVVAAPAPVRA